jgi:hypothetical protein
MRAMFALAVLAFAHPAAAGEHSIALKEGAGKDLVEANCVACHSLDYIEMNAPFLDQEKWEATIKKMIDRFGRRSTKRMCRLSPTIWRPATVRSAEVLNGRLISRVRAALHRHLDAPRGAVCWVTWRARRRTS